MGLFCVVAATLQRFFSTFANETYDAGPVDRGEKSLGNELAAQMKLVADNVTVVVLPNTGHWILEERPKETTDAQIKFL